MTRGLERLAGRILAVLVPLDRMDREFCAFANDTDEED